MPQPLSNAIVPTAGALSWGSVTGRDKPAAIVPAAPAAPVPAPETLGRVLRHGEQRTVTRSEEIAALYGLDASSEYENRGIDQIEAVDRVTEAWARHKQTRVERPEFHDAKGAVKTVAADLHNVGSLIGNILFGD